MKAVPCEHAPGAVGIVTGGTLRCLDFMHNLGNLLVPPKTTAVWVQGLYLANNRNEVVCRMLDNPDLQWLMFLDDDNPPPADHVMRLLEHLGEHPIVGSLYFSRKFPFMPHVYKYAAPEADWPKGDERFQNYAQADLIPDALMSADGVGTSGLMIRRDVLEKLGRFCFDFYPTPGGGALGEDLAFCHRARQAGYPIVVDTAAILPHETKLYVRPKLTPGQVGATTVLDFGPDASVELV